MSLVINERSGQLQELRRQMLLREQEVHELRRDKEREMGGEKEHLQSLLKEKEAFIKVSVHTCIPLLLFPVYLKFTVCFTRQELMQGQEEAMQLSSKESEAEMKTLQEELQLALRKEREAQVSVWTLKDNLYLYLRNHWGGGKRDWKRGGTTKGYTNKQ